MRKSLARRKHKLPKVSIQLQEAEKKFAELKKLTVLYGGFCPSINFQLEAGSVSTGAVDGH